MTSTVYTVPKRADSPVFSTMAEAEAYVHQLLIDNDALESWDEDEYLREWLKIEPLVIELYVTSAPDNYDYQVVAIGQEGELRVVGIRPADVKFQLARYSSGLHFAAPYNSSEHRYFVESPRRR